LAASLGTQWPMGDRMGPSAEDALAAAVPRLRNFSSMSAAAWLFGSAEGTARRGKSSGFAPGLPDQLQLPLDRPQGAFFQLSYLLVRVSFELEQGDATLVLRQLGQPPLHL